MIIFYGNLEGEFGSGDEGCLCFRSAANLGFWKGNNSVGYIGLLKRMALTKFEKDSSTGSFIFFCTFLLFRFSVLFAARHFGRMISHMCFKRNGNHLISK